MIRLITGRAGSGKTEMLLREIAGAVKERRSGIILLVPEQSSHETERLLAESCPDALSLCAEVLTFSRMVDRVLSETGGAQEGIFDKGARILTMSRALRSVKNRLKVYSSVAEKHDFLEELLKVLDDFKNSGASPEKVLEAADSVAGSFGDKLRDLALICQAYDAETAAAGIDPADTLTRLVNRFDISSLKGTKEIYADGFADFKIQQLEVLERFVSSGAELTVTLCCPKLSDKSGADQFAVERSTASRLFELARRCGVQIEEIHLPEPMTAAAEPLRFLESTFLGRAKKKYDGELKGEIELFRLDSFAEECEVAAAKVMELVKMKGLRWRDIAVCARGFDSMMNEAESIFGQYGIPFYTSGRSSIMKKPLMGLIDAALECVCGSWSHEEVFRYLKTDLTGMERDEYDILENYVLQWDIKGSLWTSGRPWAFSPEGYERARDEEEREKRLSCINDLRARAAEPLLMLREEGRKAQTAREQCLAIYAFLEKIGLAERLSQRSAELRGSGEEQAADEYRQLWGILVSALENTADILGDTPMGQGEFSRLFRLVLSQYDVGTIPQTLDRVFMGDISRLRSRQVKCLIVLGANDGALPAVSDGGILSDGEKVLLEEFGLRLSAVPGERLHREMALIYTALTRAQQKLVMSCSSVPAAVFTKIKSVFSIDPVRSADMDGQQKTWAFKPCFELAAETGADKSTVSASAEAALREDGSVSAHLDDVRRAALSGVGKLSPRSTGRLYEQPIKLTASRAEDYRKCPYSYFMRYGLHAKRRIRAEIDPRISGILIHYTLEKTLSEAYEKHGGVKELSDRQIAAIAKRNIRRYLKEALGGMEDKSGRFRFLFERLERDVIQIAQMAADELRNSRFVPMAFEQRFKDAPESEKEYVIDGTADRVDIWDTGESAYLRVMDYKSGEKKFSLADVCGGIGMQMLIYLFEMQKRAEAELGKPVIPAGILYYMARTPILAAPRDATDDKLKADLASKLKPSGLLLRSDEVLKAMDERETPLFITLTEKSKKGLASALQFAQLEEHVDKIMREISQEIRSGEIAADPLFEKNEDKSPCERCDFREACSFDENKCETKRILRSVSDDEAWKVIAGGGQKEI
ncbi:MAG: PD-(D/E)XK nuclease family protein [Oscillospiraceae bacterium]|nr:PD-(D/E)XK nuclease family protein [Oscillospiraceae bacterium]